MMFWKKYKEAVLILSFLCLMGAVYYLVISRLMTEIRSNSNKLQELGATHEIRQKRLGNMPKLKKDFEMLEEAEKKLDPFLEKDRAVELIQEVERFAENTGNEVVIEAVPQEAPAKGTAKSAGANETIIGGLPAKDYIQLKIKATGTFFSLLKLLNKLENSRYYLDVVSLQISRNQNPEREKAEESISKNPFDQEASEKDPAEGQREETVSMINLVVYTKN